MGIRFAAEADAPALLAIYAQYIETGITFEYELPSREEFARRIREFGGTYPYLIWEEDGRIVGYAYAHPEREREAYQFNTELSIYLDQAATGRGIGRRLYSALMDLLVLQGARTAYGVVTDPNPASERIHEKLGFTCVGREPHTAYKFGWVGLSTWWLPLRKGNAAPEKTHPLPAEQLAAILKKYSA